LCLLIDPYYNIKTIFSQVGAGSKPAPNTKPVKAADLESALTLKIVERIAMIWYDVTYGF
jgi:hypothetical protein